MISKTNKGRTAGGYTEINFCNFTTAHDCSAVIYAIAITQKSGVVNIDFSNCSIRENQVKMLADALASKCGSLQVRKLSLANNSLSDISIVQLFQRASTAFQSLEELNLSHNMIGAGSIKQIATTLARSPYNNLAELDLSHNPLGVPGIQALVEVLCADKLVSLEELSLEESLNCDDNKSEELLIALYNALTHCPKFLNLELSHNYFDVNDLSQIANGSLLKRNGKLCITSKTHLIINCLKTFHRRSRRKRGGEIRHKI